MADWVDFASVKAAVSIEMVITHYSIETRKVNASSLRGDCPLPTHSDDATKNSFAVNTEKNAWACQSSSCVSARAGKTGGNVLDFVAVMEGCSVRDAALKLQDWFNVQASNERPEGYVRACDREKSSKKLAAEKKKGEAVAASSDTEDSDESREVNQPLGFALKSVDTSHPYIRHRGIKEETAKHFGIGFFHGRGSMSERVVIPIHNEAGELIAYAGRAVDDEIEPKYKLPSGFHKSLVLFNLHRVLEQQSREVVIVEGYFDCLKIHQAGFPCVVALMGSTLCDHQGQLITDNFDHVIVMLDGDEGGRAATEEIVSRLAHKVFIRTVDVPEGTQPDRLSSVELQKLLAFLR